MANYPIHALNRCEFEDENMKAIFERLTNLDAVVDKESANLLRFESQKTRVGQEIQESEKELGELHLKLKALEEVRDKKTKELEHAKRNALKASKSLDQALKDISSWVCRFKVMLSPLLTGLGRTTEMKS
jgi:structural maintenance of chromosome 1